MERPSFLLRTALLLLSPSLFYLHLFPYCIFIQLFSYPAPSVKLRSLAGGLKSIFRTPPVCSVNLIECIYTYK